MKQTKRKNSNGNSVIAVFVLLLLAPLWLPLLVLWSVFYLGSIVCLHLAVWTLWLPRSKRLLFIYSDSPVWQNYIQERIIPQIQDQAVILNWSRRKKWSYRQFLAVAVFRHFGGRREFNPLAIVFRPFRLGRVFRFYQPFHDFKRGHPESLVRVESDFFGYLSPNGLRPNT
jgi:hypothetical protein